MLLVVAIRTCLTACTCRLREHLLSNAVRREAIRVNFTDGIPPDICVYTLHRFFLFLTDTIVY
jgi:hypothetical protein